MKAFQLSALNRNFRGGCVVQSIADFKKDLLPLFEEVLEVNGLTRATRYHQTDKWFRFPWTRRKMHVVSAEKQIRGPNWAYAVINESTLISHRRYKEAIGRVRIKGAPNPQIASSGTPEGTANYVNEIFIEKPMKGSRIIYGDTRDNQVNLNDDYIPTLEASYDETMLDAYLRGLFINMKGGRFYYAYDPAINDDDTIEQIEGLEVRVSLDYNVAPMQATLWNIVEVANARGVPLVMPNGMPIRRAQAFDQIEIADGADTKKMCAAMTAYGLDPDTTTIYPDPAGRARSTKGPPDNEQLKAHGWYKIKTRLAAPAFRKRQLAVNNLLGRGFITLNPAKCKALKKDFMGVEQDQATLEKIKDNPKMTHASDGCDYFVDIEFPLSGQKPNPGSTRIR